MLSQSHFSESSSDKFFSNLHPKHDVFVQSQSHCNKKFGRQNYILTNLHPKHVIVLLCRVIFIQNMMWQICTDLHPKHHVSCRAIFIQNMLFCCAEWSSSKTYMFCAERFSSKTCCFVPSWFSSKTWCAVFQSRRWCSYTAIPFDISRNFLFVFWLCDWCMIDLVPLILAMHYLLHTFPLSVSLSLWFFWVSF